MADDIAKAFSSAAYMPDGPVAPGAKLEEDPPLDLIEGGDVTEDLLRDIATDLYNEHELARMHAIDEAAVRAIAGDELYQPLLAAYRAEWYAEPNRDTRVARKLAYLTESGLDELAGVLFKDGPPGTKLAVFDSLTKLANQRKADTGPAAPRFAINIMIGQQPVRIDGRVIEQEVEE